MVSIAPKTERFLARQNLRLLVLVATIYLIFNSAPAFSFMTSEFDINLGQTAFQAKSQINQQSQTTNIDSLSALETNYCLHQTSFKLGYCMSFFELLQTKEGSLSFTRFAVGLRWYPLGMNGSRVIFDNQVQGKFWKPTPFGGISIGVANLSTRNYNASFTDATLRLGAQIPITTRILLLGQLMFSGSFSTGTTDSSRAITYLGESALIGIVITQFFD